MAYRKLNNYCAKKLANMRRAKHRNRELGVPPDYPLSLPDVRRQVFIFDYDFGFVPYLFELRKTNRVNCYDVYADGKLTFSRIGWNRLLKMIGKAFPAVCAS